MIVCIKRSLIRLMLLFLKKYWNLENLGKNFNIKYFWLNLCMYKNWIIYKLVFIIGLFYIICVLVVYIM